MKDICKFCRYFDKASTCTYFNHANTGTCMYFEDNGEMRFYDINFYEALLERFINTGLYENPDNTDALCNYLETTFSSATIQIQVLSSPLKSLIFRNVMLCFFSTVLDRMKLNYMSAQGEQSGMNKIGMWSQKKKKDGWQALVSQIENKFDDYGFPSNFYKAQFEKDDFDNKPLWEKMIEDWREALKQKLKTNLTSIVANNMALAEHKLNTYTEDIPQYLKQNDISFDDFKQTWTMMNGTWNKSEFQRLMRIVSIQHVYPDIARIVQKMGRMAKDDAQEWMSLSQGSCQNIEHSSHSDILGVTMSNDINSLLPLELAQFFDPDTENIFFHRYLTSRLQTFRYKSEVMKPSHQLNTKPVVRRGPMIVCIDTSGSMKGTPEKIGQSALIKIIDTAISQKRDCFIIAFSVSIKPIDAIRQHTDLMKLFSCTTSGDTSATEMLKATFNLLDSSIRYANADVLWITDFRIPMPHLDLLETMQKLRKENTCFYGLQIGNIEHSWHAYFDEIVSLAFTPARKF